MSEPTDRPDLAALADRIETAWDDNADMDAFRVLIADWLAARRAARDAGYVEVMVSRESLAALRESYRSIFNAEKACSLLARDLADVLKAGQ